jgi:single-strand DNA-binding protein
MNSTITLVGNLTREPELRHTPNGSVVANFGLAVNRRWRAGEDWQEQTSFFNVVAWRELGENVASSLRRGDLVVVHGRLEQRSWTTEAGDRRSTVEVVADDVGPSLRWATAQVTRRHRVGTDEDATLRSAA